MPDKEELGPATALGFAEAASLDELIEAGGGTSSRSTQARASEAEVEASAAPAPVPQGPPLDKDLFKHLVSQFDRVVSAIVKVDVEEPQLIESLAEGCYPLANFYSQQAGGETYLWLSAGISIVSYVSLKYAKLQAKHVGEPQGDVRRAA